MKFWLSILLVFAVLLLVSTTITSAQEEPVAVKILKVTRPHIVVAQVCCNHKIEKVRIKLAGVKPPLGNFTLFEQGKTFLQELLQNREVYFDFAIGHNQQEKTWVGFLYIKCQCQEGEEWILVNGELIKEGLAEVDVETAGENQLPYLLSLQEEAINSQKGIWKVQKPSSHRRSDEECPSCVR